MVLRTSIAPATTLAPLVAALAIAGCGAQVKSAAPSAQAISRAFKGSPPVLAAVHAQADELLSGGPAAFAARLRALRGHPVVINKWGSWCPPCKTEFPAFQQAAVKYGRDVAFLGIDGKDRDSSARAFLRRFPVTYPSYSDPGESIARMVGAATYYPQTLYLTSSGRMIYDHAGPYTTASALERDIRFYALGHS